VSTPPVDLPKAHRWFAIELNNRAWELIEAPARTAEQAVEMVTAALASRYHWFACGTLLNKLRAESLAAAAYLAAGHADLSLSHSRACLALSDQAGAEATPFDLACAYGGLACALERLGDHEQARAEYAQALEHAQQFEHADDRAVFEKLYPFPSQPEA
jgi:hypothetical protein